MNDVADLRPVFALAPVAASGHRLCPTLQGLVEAGAWGVTVPACVVDRRVAALRHAVEASGLVISGVTAAPAGPGPSLTAPRREERRRALGDLLRAVEGAAALGARSCVATAGPLPPAFPSTGVVDALARGREAFDFAAAHARDQAPGVSLAVAAPARPTATRLVGSVGDALAFLATLDRPSAVGLDVGPVAGCDAGAVRAVALAIASGRLDGVRVGGPADAADGIGLFGGAAPDVLFLLVHLLLASGYDGPWHLGVAPDVDDEDGWERARGLVRAGRVLAAKVRRSQDDPTIKDALADCGADALADETVGPYTPAAARALVADRAGPVLADAATHAGRARPARHRPRPRTALTAVVDDAE